MECRQAQSLVDAYLDRELSQKVTVELELHLQHCSTCRSKCGPLLQMLCSPQPVKVPQMLGQRIAEALDEVVAVPPSQRNFKWPLLAGAIAASLLLFVAGWICSRFWSTPIADSQRDQVVVVVSPWLLSSVAQAVVLPGPANPAVCLVQAAFMEQVHQQFFEIAPDIRMERELIIDEVDEEDLSDPAREISLLPTFYRL